MDPGLSLERLTDWAAPAGFEFRTEPPVRPTSIEIAAFLPEVVRTTFAGGLAEIVSTLSTSGDFHRTASITRGSKLRITIEEPLVFAEWLERFLGPVERLMSLATCRPITIEQWLLVDPASTDEVEVVWPHAAHEEDQDRRLLPDEVLFWASSIFQEASPRLDAWLNLTVPFRPVLDMFFATRRATPMFEEDRFQNLVQALEAYHRRAAGARPDAEEHARRTAIVLDAVPESEREWLEEILSISKEYRLSDRIEQVVDRHPWLVGDVVPRKVRKWAWRVAAARNLRAHQDPDAPPIGTTGDELVGFVQRLNVLLEASLLAELRFEEADIEEMIKRASSAYRILKLNPRL
ncbi:MAG: HEPN domain-containing protein [Candidatus Limnocylindrales bacterium]